MSTGVDSSQDVSRLLLTSLENESQDLQPNMSYNSFVEDGVWIRVEKFLMCGLE